RPLTPSSQQMEPPETRGGSLRVFGRSTVPAHGVNNQARHATPKASPAMPNLQRATTVNLQAKQGYWQAFICRRLASSDAAQQCGQHPIRAGPHVLGTCHAEPVPNPGKACRQPGAAPEVVGIG